MTKTKLWNGKIGGESEESYKASILSQIFFFWILPVLKIGNKRELFPTDIKRNVAVRDTQLVSKEIEKAWESELLRRKHKASLTRVLFKVFGGRIALCIIYTSVKDAIFRVIQGPFLAVFLGYSYGTYSYGVGMGSAFLLLVFAGLYTAVHHYSIFCTLSLGLEVKTALSAIIFKKILKLSPSSMTQYSIGKISNIISNDLNRFTTVLQYAPCAIASPLQAITVTLVLWLYFGPSCLAGVALVFILFPIQVIFGKLYGKIRFVGASKTDLRVRIMNEILNGILLIKMLTWEPYFAKRVAFYRKQEMQTFQKKMGLDAVIKSLGDVTSKLVIFVIFLCFILLGNPVTAIGAFVGLTLTNYLRIVITHYFPQALSGIFEIHTSIRRIEALLLMEEKVNEVVNGGPGIVVEKLSAKWDIKTEDFLQDISFTAEPGEMTAIIGPVGCGKSSLLHSILGELPSSSGMVRHSGKVAYVAQQPWIFSGSVQSNILNGNKYDPIWYRTVIQVCALERDMELFPFGDMSLVGDRGISLSGGQKARVSLARAVYTKADIYLLDDPLSAVDAHVGHHIFSQCIDGVLSSKTVILATHQVHLLENAFQILVMDGGRIVTKGGYRELRDKKLLDYQPEEERQRRDSSFSVEDEAAIAEVVADIVIKPVVTESGNYGTFPSTAVGSGLQQEKKEHQSKGAVGMGLHWKYFRYGNPLILLLFFFLMNIVVQVLLSGSDYWLKIWMNRTQSPKEILKSASNDTQQDLQFETDMSYAFIYLWIVLGLLVAAVARNLQLMWTCIKSSTALYNKLFSTVLRVPMLFFEQNSFGRILNRFTNDVGVMDEVLPNLYYNTITITLNALGVGVIVAILQPIMILPTVILLPFLYYFRRMYLRTTSSLRRIESMARSPIFGLISSTLNGIISVRAYKLESKYEIEFCTLLNEQTRIYFQFLGTSRWFASTLDWFCNIYLICLVIASIIFPGDISSIALTITQALSLSNILSFGISQTAELDNQIVCVERILEYTDLKPEGDPKFPGKQPPVDWPRNGKIQMDHLMIKYADNPPVLHNLSFIINPKEKIGVVGRTGAGKSTLLASMFRIVESAAGSIHIDDLDVSKIGLEYLRCKISVIPQNPVLFIGTLRENFDPFGKYSDSDLWRVLTEVQLVDRITTFSVNGLDSEISESGGNFSQGEKQLLCLARALLNKTRILILDEATANIDLKTDALIQKTIREKFVDCTVITIAHRLDTVMDSDKILVLDSGRIMEFDEPYQLLQNPNGNLRQFCEDAGPSAARKLTAIARRRHNAQNPVA